MFFILFVETHSNVSPLSYEENKPCKSSGAHHSQLLPPRILPFLMHPGMGVRSRDRHPWERIGKHKENWDIESAEESDANTEKNRDKQRRENESST